MTASGSERFDVAVAGAGVVGLATALAIASAPGPRARVLVCDPGLAEKPAGGRSLRALAIAPAARRLLEQLGVWAVVAETAQPMLTMRLTDSRPGATPAPSFLTFPDVAEQDEPLAHMVVQDDLRAALLERCRLAGVVLRPAAVSGTRSMAAALRLDGLGGEATARLLVAADGARSRLREAAGIRSIAWDYGQAGVVATLAHSVDHRGEALQHFLPAGPLALLPMRDASGGRHRSSIVWTEREAEAARLAQLPDAAFCAALSASGGFERGALTLEDRPAAFPLRLRMARALTAERFALAGDAARTIHPLAGQGLNLGLQDAEALARQASGALRLGLDPGSPRVLAAYAQERRAGQVAMAAATDMLNRLFSNDAAPVRAARDIGLGLVDRSPALKRWFSRQAAG